MESELGKIIKIILMFKKKLLLILKKIPRKYEDRKITINSKLSIIVYFNLLVASAFTRFFYVLYFLLTMSVRYVSIH